MRIIKRKTLKDFWEAGHADAKQPLETWFEISRKADWYSPDAVKQVFRNASIIADNRVVFNIGGNKYRLVVKINYPYRVVYIRFVGTHKEYDRVNVEEV